MGGKESLGGEDLAPRVVRLAGGRMVTLGRDDVAALCEAFRHRTGVDVLKDGVSPHAAWLAYSGRMRKWQSRAHKKRRYGGPAYDDDNAG